MLLLLPLWALLSSASATVLYVNGLRADGLRSFELEDVDVRIDEQGNVWITAPQYGVSVAGGVPAAAPPPVAAAPFPAPPTTYWLITEDRASHGQVVEIWINQKLVKLLRSGQPALQLDLTPYLQKGHNNVVLHGTGAGAVGGSLGVRIGSGSQIAGQVSLDRIEIDYQSSTTSTAESNLSQVLVVP